MILNTLIKGTLIKRYKRFLADVKLETGEIVSCHCPNSGSMLGLIEKNYPVFLSERKNPKNKLKYKLELIEIDHTLVGINTMYSNKIVFEALINRQISQLNQFDTISPETKFNNSRFDFFLKSSTSDETAFLEVKNVTLKRQENIAEFPDAKTARGSKHLTDLIQAKNQNIRAINLYLVQREDCTYFKIAKDIDNIYYNNVILSKEHGVEFLCYQCEISTNNIILKKPLEIIYD